jgi:hypothetical protein
MPRKPSAYTWRRKNAQRHGLTKEEQADATVAVH